jgi:hypothetical protein
MFNIWNRSDNKLIIGKELHFSNEMDKYTCISYIFLIKDELLGFILRNKVMYCTINVTIAYILSTYLVKDNTSMW